MEIVYILPDKDAGVASVVRNLLKYKSEKFATKTILLHDSQSDPLFRIKDDFNSDVVIRIEYNGYWHSKSQIAGKIRKHITNNSILVSNDGAIELESIKLLQYQIPIVYILHGDYQHYYRVINEHAEIIDGIIGVSKHVVTKVKNIKQCSNIIVSNIKFPIPAYTYDKCAFDNKIRIAFVGTLNEFKGVLGFEKILSKIESYNIPYHFNVIGDGPLKKSLEKLFQYNKNVSFKGNIDNLQVLKLHSEHDIIILPSKNEGLPVSIVEAMKAGVVPLASNIKSGIPELISDGITGYKIEIGKESEYAEHIKFLFKNPAKLQEMSKNCIAFANSEFDPLKQTLAYESFYQQVFDSYTVHVSKKKKSPTFLLNYMPNFIAFQVRKRLKKKK